MGKANELRLGNWIESDNKEWVGKKWVTSRVQFQINERQFVNTFSGQDEFDFIPLTTEWMLGFGLEEPIDDDRELNYGNINGYRFNEDKNGIWSIEIGGGYHTSEIKLPYIHKLQNIMFELTGSELTLRSNTDNDNRNNNR